MDHHEKITGEEVSIFAVYFIVGFISGTVSYLFYTYYISENRSSRIPPLQGFFGAILAGFISGLLAMVVDRSLAFAILTGLSGQFVYISMVKAMRSKQIFSTIREVLIKLLTQK